MDEALQDERFSHILKDPRFRKIPRNLKKIKVDKRFKNMFKDKKFVGKSHSDERGRHLNLAPSENLKKLYHVASDSSDDEDEKANASDEETNVDGNDMTTEESVKTSKRVGTKLSENIISDSNDEDEITIKKNRKKKKSNKMTKSEKKLDDYEEKASSISKNKASVKSKTLGKNVKKNSPNFYDEKPNYITKIKTPMKSKKSTTTNVFTTPDSSNEDDANVVNETSLISKEVDELKDSNDEESSNEEEEKECSSSESSDSESEDSDDSGKNDEFDHKWEELNADAPDTDEVTRRLAVCNMDWDRIRAEDLFVVLNSFKPPDGIVYSVKIYPSEFGLKRIQEEKLKGPAELVEEVVDPDEEENEQKTSKYHREKLRQYQINRLKYFYAVVECDTSETANTLYEQLNGMEYENSSSCFDLRFIPDDVTFDQAPTSTTDKVPEPTEYKPRKFVTSALQQVKVNLTWDETDHKRRETLQKAFTEPESIEKDIRDYLASSSEDSDDEPEEVEDGMKLSTKERIEKYKALLQSLEDKEKESEEKYEMEVTWVPGLKEKTEEIVKEKLQNESITPFEEMLKKRKEDRKLKKKQKNENEANASSDSEEDSNEMSDSKTQDKEDTGNLDELYLISDSKEKHQVDEKSSKKKKNKIKKPENFMCDVQDPRFSAIYSSHLYNIDPSDPHFKNTEGNLAIIKEKQERLKQKHPPTEHQRKTKKAKYS